MEERMGGDQSQQRTEIAALPDRNRQHELGQCLGEGNDDSALAGRQPLLKIAPFLVIDRRGIRRAAAPCQSLHHCFRLRCRIGDSQREQSRLQLGIETGLGGRYNKAGRTLTLDQPSFAPLAGPLDHFIPKHALTEQCPQEVRAFAGCNGICFINHEHTVLEILARVDEPALAHGGSSYECALDGKALPGAGRTLVGDG
jgi:hypothetical protein